MKIVTYNVNGLRPRVSQHGSLLNLLNSLDADIICFQETKLPRQDLSSDLTMADGYEAFFSCTRTSRKGRTSYSGVATFCRVNSAFSSNEVVLPLTSEEGITGLLENSRKRKSLERSTFLEGLDNVTIDDLLKVDNEGRCIITDHGHFVLFNLYGPRAEIDDKERIHFKIIFFSVLQKRWEYLLSLGKRVFVVGDLNIAPAAIDCCEAKPDFEDNWFRKWLRSSLVDYGGQFFDCFRGKHPDRKDAYTCWAQNVGAEEFNLGSRIDHIFISGPCFHEGNDSKEHNILDCHVEECDIMLHFQRGKLDSASKWKGGRTTKLEGSDHAPVYLILKDVPDLPVHHTPQTAIRYAPEVRGQQETILSLLKRRQIAVGVKCHESISSLNENIIDQTFNPNSSLSQTIGTSNAGSVLLGMNSSDLIYDGFSKDHGDKISDCMSEKGKLSTYNVKQRMKKNHCSQRTIQSFFGKSGTVSLDFDHSDITSLTEVDTVVIKNDFPAVTNVTSTSISTTNDKDEEVASQHETDLGFHGGDEDDLSISSFSEKQINSSFLKWQTIREQMHNSLPLCKGHGEPCVARSVKKTGPNIGRGFYVCARAKGPRSNPDANCNHFQWASSKWKQK